MSKIEILISSLLDRDAQLIIAMTSFRELQSNYKVFLTINNFIAFFSIKIIAIFYYIVLSTLLRRLQKQMQSLKDAYIYRQQLNKAKKLLLIK